METETFDIIEAAKAQANLCSAKGYPHFAPTSGRCYNCGKNIYQQIDHGDFKTGVSVERAGHELITGCPHCHYSYCE